MSVPPAPSPGGALHRQTFPALRCRAWYQPHSPLHPPVLDQNEAVSLKEPHFPTRLSIPKGPHRACLWGYPGFLQEASLGDLVTPLTAQSPLLSFLGEAVMRTGSHSSANVQGDGLGPLSPLATEGPHLDPYPGPPNSVVSCEGRIPT